MGSKREIDVRVLPRPCPAHPAHSLPPGVSRTPACRTVLTVILLLLSAGAVSADSVLAGYLEQGLQNNLALREKQVQLEKSDVEITGAWGRLLPTLSIQSRYTWSHGGREIDFPVGDLLNPVYEGLNLLTPGAPYPTDLENETLTLMPGREQETKITITQPLVVPRLYYNVKLGYQIKRTRELDLRAYKRLLTERIKQAYYSYLKAGSLLQVYRKMEELLQENLRVSAKLVQSGKATEDAVYRAKAEIASMSQKILAAEKGRQNAASLFNFLVRRPSTAGIELPEANAPDPGDEGALSAGLTGALDGREEIALLEQSIAIQKTSTGLALSGYIPEISASFDYGYHGEDYSFSLDRDFWTFSFVGRWNLFSGLQNANRAVLAEKESQRLQLQLEGLRERIKLEVEESYNNLAIARRAIQAAVEEQTSMQKSFEIVSKKYTQGMVPQMEFLDAQARLTNAEINRLIARYDYLLQYAHFESVTCRARQSPRVEPPR